MYVRRRDDSFTIMCIWVDDGIICSTSVEELENIVNYLNKQFEITSGPVDQSTFVGIKIRRNRSNKTIHLSQEKYLKKILEKFNMSNCYSRLNPVNPSCHLTKMSDCQDEEKQGYPYREAIGSLIFAATCTSGVLLMLNGGPIAWSSHRQKCVSLSTTESEYVAAAAASKEIIWTRRLGGYRMVSTKPHTPKLRQPERHQTNPQSGAAPAHETYWREIPLHQGPPRRCNHWCCLHQHRSPSSWPIN